MYGGGAEIRYRQNPKSGVRKAADCTAETGIIGKGNGEGELSIQTRAKLQCDEGNPGKRVWVADATGKTDGCAGYAWVRLV
jgi:hypothetical protein